jgi:hypothetical protein
MKITEIIVMEATKLVVYYGTSSRQLPAILATGIASPSWWGTQVVASYCAETVAEEDESEPVVVEASINQFDMSALEADGNSIAEPLTHTLRSTEDALYRRWQKSDGSWKSSLRIYGSVIYRGTAVKIEANQAVNISPATKPQPNGAQADNYRRMLRLLSWGRQLSPEDQNIKSYIERKYDVSRIKI